MRDLANRPCLPILCFESVFVLTFSINNPARACYNLSKVTTLHIVFCYLPHLFTLAHSQPAKFRTILTVPLLPFVA